MDGTINKPIKQRQADAKQGCPWQESSCGSDKEVKSIRQLIIASADKWHHQCMQTEAPGTTHSLQSGTSELVEDAFLCLILEEYQLTVYPLQSCAQELEGPVYSPWAIPFWHCSKGGVHVWWNGFKRILYYQNLVACFSLLPKHDFLNVFIFLRDSYLTYQSGLKHDYSGGLLLHLIYLLKLIRWSINIG